MMNNSDTHHLKIDGLADIREIHISKDLPREKRIEEFIRQIKNPYHFKCGEITVHVSFTPN